MVVYSEVGPGHRTEEQKGHLFRGLNWYTVDRKFLHLWSLQCRLPTACSLAPLGFGYNVGILPLDSQHRLPDVVSAPVPRDTHTTESVFLLPAQDIISLASEIITLPSRHTHIKIYPTTPNPDTRKPLQLPCYLLNTHSPNEDFCGRKEILEHLAAELLPSKSVVTASGTTLRQFALCGFGGIGKTEIAREYSRRRKASFDAVFWVVADEIAKLDHHYQQISLALGLEDPSQCKSQALSNPRKYLSGSDESVQPGHAGSDATWLLIFDNADDPMILADYWPQGRGLIFITSRDPLARSMFTRKSLGLDLGPLSQNDSISLFNQLTTISNESEEHTVRQISDALGGVLLAISQMAGIVRRQDLTLPEFLELYTDHEEHASLYETKFDTNLITYRHSISTVWAFEKLRPQARKLLELISFLETSNSSKYPFIALYKMQSWQRWMLRRNGSFSTRSYGSFGKTGHRLCLSHRKSQNYHSQNQLEAGYMLEDGLLSS
ncbi:hypothetical protein TSTA_037680 [Talaromyces stipitatus ATCC 10500]|uniref:NB-ARC domain-containing protein n=1 Tax=Talaromyces stipitatus (strain ATCC 10500 / CBS 375.48 / QM 6759 / NRRL 1006) TaxID=441959 RepID=B8M8N7_TALSN|nr:uncharacterized protein TSTA_037680 [Talaromyces stipitatus ATCC 10500]EED20550.1 hypothetical protein TSTA_037680 [Talaromyces stipitatus ATCC 10500]